MLKDTHPVRFVSKQLKVHENVLYRWILEYEKYGERVFSGNGSGEFSALKETKRLEKENIRLKEELDTLKKFQDFLKQNHD
ncbi:transposase [Listeria ivanovii]|uniref:transposase n=1 Tax=Listeria ivanovii TaxID=1638 RepID=UPI001626DC34|nr:transposase [Listeria ivanovii]